MTEKTTDDNMAEPKYEPYVDAERCIGCGLCPDMLDSVFALNDDKFGIAYVHDSDAWRPDDTEQLELTAQNCPVDAINLYPDQSSRGDTGEE